MYGSRRLILNSLSSALFQIVLNYFSNPTAIKHSWSRTGEVCGLVVGVGTCLLRCSNKEQRTIVGAERVMSVGSAIHLILACLAMIIYIYTIGWSFEQLFSIRPTHYNPYISYDFFPTFGLFWQWTKHSKRKSWPGKSRGEQYIFFVACCLPYNCEMSNMYTQRYFVYQSVKKTTNFNTFQNCYFIVKNVLCGAWQWGLLKRKKRKKLSEKALWPVKRWNLSTLKQHEDILFSSYEVKTLACNTLKSRDSKNSGWPTY